MYKIIINRKDEQGQYVFIQQSFVENKCFNEKLTSGTIVINNVEKLDIEPFDEIQIYDDSSKILNGFKNFYVGDILFNVSEFKNNKPFKYNYTINFTSLIRDAERIILPNVSVTQSLVGERKTIKNELDRIVELFGLNYYNKFSNDERLNKECPEITLQNPTLKEAIDALLEPINCIVTSDRKSELKLLDLTTVSKEIDMTKVVDFNGSYTSGDYCNYLKSDVRNAIDNSNNIVSTTVKMFNLSARATNNNILTTETLEIDVGSPIYSIKKVYAILPSVLEYYYDSSMDKVRRNVTLRVDITNRVLEQKNYNEKTSLDQVNYLKFSRGNNIIDGLSYKIKNLTESYGIFSSIIASLKDQGLIATDNPNGIGFDLPSILDNDPLNIMYDVEFETLAGLTLITHKNEKVRNNLGLINNQNDAYVDTQKFGLNLKNTINRIGNPQFEMIYRCKNENELPQLGDFCEDYKLVEMSINYLENEIIAHLFLCKNYIMKNLFYGVNSKKRSYQYAEQSDAFLRLDNQLYKVMIGYSSPLNPTLTKELLSFVENTDKRNNKYKINGLTFKTTYKSGEQSEEIIIGFSKRICGTSVAITFINNDNICAGLQNLGYEKDYFGSGGWNQKQIKYVDENGEFETATIKYYNVVDDPTKKAFPSDAIVFAESVSHLLPVNRVTKPMLSENFFTYNVLIKKDNREIFGLTTQFEYLSNNTKDFIIGSGLAKLCPFIFDDFDFEFKLLGSNEFFDKTIFDNVNFDEIEGSIDVDYNTNSIIVNSNAIQNYKGYVICAKILNDNKEIIPLIYVNQRENVVNKIDFSVVKE